MRGEMQRLESEQVWERERNRRGQMQGVREWGLCREGAQQMAGERMLWSGGDRGERGTEGDRCREWEIEWGLCGVGGRGGHNRWKGRGCCRVGETER